MVPKGDTVTILLDGKSCDVPRGATILEAARRQGIYIPTLCTHEDLLPFGACRMCLVEVDGMRGFPTACTTPVQDGMIVKTESDMVKELRREVLRLTLSHHPCGCIACEESEECRAHSGTTRKAGVTTGCRTCPNDGACELQDVVDHVGLEDVDLPIYYRGLAVEKDDPFYDRDYNLCILCGRCVRICQDMRAAGTLAFQKRGGRTVIGPAFGRTHLESGCEFCGACVSACPTGALSEKIRKWDGMPDREETTTCPLCGVGCQVRLLVKAGRIIGSLPMTEASSASLGAGRGNPGERGEDRSGGQGGDACVKGRFCLSEIVNDHRRLKKPYAVVDNAKVEIEWDDAIARASERLASCPPERFAMLVSPNCTNEDLYVAQKLSRAAMRSNNVDTGARTFYGAGFKSYLALMKLAVPVSRIAEASVILAIGLDARFGRSGVGRELRKAIHRGARLITIHPREHSLSFLADEWFRPEPNAAVETLESLARALETSGLERGGAANGFSKAARLLLEASSPVILVGPDAVHDGRSETILEIIERLARALNAGVLTLPAQNNLYGSILMGAYPELLPGGFTASNKSHIDTLKKVWGLDLPDFTVEWTSDSLARNETDSTMLDVLYLVGEVPVDERPPAAFVIYQHITPPKEAACADLVLPAATFAEVDGTVVSGDGRIRRLKKAVDPPGDALPDWEILSRIGRRMGAVGFDFADVRDVHREIAGLVRGFGDFDSLETTPVPLSIEGEVSAARFAVPVGNDDTGPDFPFVLDAAVEENTYRGFPISTWVGGARDIFPDGCVDISPADAEKAGIAEGDDVVVWSAGFERTWRARITADQAEGFLRVTLRAEERPASPRRVNLRRRDV